MRKSLINLCAVMIVTMVGCNHHPKSEVINGTITLDSGMVIDTNTLRPLIVETPTITEEECRNMDHLIEWDDEANSCGVGVKFRDGREAWIYINEDYSFNRELTLKKIKERK